MTRFSEFSNLRILNLFGLDGNVSKLGQDIANVLIASPSLKILGLSMHFNSLLSQYGELTSARNTDLMLLEIIVDSCNMKAGILRISWTWMNLLWYLVLSQSRILLLVLTLRLNWDPRLSTETAQSIYRTLFVAHQEAIGLQDQHFRLIHISIYDN